MVIKLERFVEVFNIVLKKIFAKRSNLNEEIYVFLNRVLVLKTFLKG